jgi:hypothetical protein
MVTNISGLAPSMSGTGTVWFVELSGTTSWPKTNGGLVINTTPEIMKIVMADLKKFESAIIPCWLDCN